MSRQWTSAQSDAIYKEGTNIIVSAGAGSGKTAVLTERVLTKLRKGININELLILTFTKAAALEMKERIRKEIKKDPSLKKQEELLESAYITTFDSYSLFVVNKYHYLLNLPHAIGIGDDNVIKLTKLKLLDQIFNELYEKQEDSFVRLITTFCVKEDDSLKSQILNIYNKLEIRYDCESYLRNYMTNNFSDEKLDQDVKEYEKLILSMKEDLRFDLESHSYLFSDKFYQKLELALSNILNSNDYDELYLNFVNFKLPVMRNESEEAKAYKETLSKRISQIIKYCSYSSKNEIMQSILKTRDYVEVIVNILLQLDQRLKGYKREKQIFSFSDIALFAIDIASKHENIAKEISESFAEILLDEYQDTSDLQEIFISKIARNNVYMVGDVKQSIYRFRNANPSLFMEKYNKYALRNGGIKIDLSKNFRSRKEVIANINDIFKLIMDDEIGNANYANDHMMEFGNTSYEDNKPDYDYNYKFLTYQKDESYKEFTDHEVEAFIIANDIKKKLNSNFQVYDAKISGYRKIKYSDVTILIDRATNFTTYRKIFDYFNIPLKVMKDEDITGSTLVKIVRNMLLLVMSYRNHTYTREFKHALTSVLRSFIYCMDDNEIYQIITNRLYKENPFFEDIKPLLAEIDRMSIKDILLSVYSLTRIEEKLIRIGNVHGNSVILEYLVNIAKNLIENDYSVTEFIHYFDQIYLNELSLVASLNSESDDVCQIMTIHKSKGLEFSICYFPGLAPKFNFSELKERFIYNKNLGIITPYFDEGIATTIYKHLLEFKEKEEEISEKIRLFYVALTRCKEQMIFVHKTFDEINGELENNKVSNFIRKKYASFLDIIKSVYHNIPLHNCIDSIDLDALNLTKEYKSFAYVFSNSVIENEVKFKVRKLNIESKLVSTKSFSKKITTLLTKKDVTNIELGLTIHGILESLDFKNPDLSVYNLTPFIKNKLEHFLSLDILRNIRNCNVYQEYEFMYEDDGELRNGIIDLLIEDSDSYKIIDYKLKKIDDNEYLSQLKGYANYINKISNKNVETYLYSFLDGTLQKLEVAV